MPVEVGWSDEEGGLHRVQGIYRPGFELSKLAVGYEGKLEDLDYVTPLV